jgi:hypothetical protein
MQARRQVRRQAWAAARGRRHVAIAQGTGRSCAGAPTHLAGAAGRPPPAPPPCRGGCRPDVPAGPGAAAPQPLRPPPPRPHPASCQLPLRRAAAAHTWAARPGTRVTSSWAAPCWAEPLPPPGGRLPPAAAAPPPPAAPARAPARAAPAAARAAAAAPAAPARAPPPRARLPSSRAARPPRRRTPDGTRPPACAGTSRSGPPGTRGA